MKEAEIWRKCYELATENRDEYKFFVRDFVDFLANNSKRNLEPVTIKSIFIDCFNLAKPYFEQKESLSQGDWIAINEGHEYLIHRKHSGSENEQLMCAELIAVVVNQLGRKDTGNE